MSVKILSVVLFSLLLEGAHAFHQQDAASLKSRSLGSTTCTRRYSFFKDMLGQAFENDRGLSPDKTKGQYDAPGEEFEDSTAKPTDSLTETQLKWRQTQLNSGNSNDVMPSMVEGTSWSLDLYLSGVPERDPSNDLYGSRVNISSRDKATGLSLPAAPSTTLTVDFLKNGICRASDSDFTSGQEGQWKLSEDGKILRFSMETVGYTRTVETKGSIQKIYWTDEDEKIVQTSTTYSIPPGFVYADIEIRQGRPVGTLDLVSGSGVLRLEKSTGLFGVASKMVACGKFEGRKND